MRGVLYLLLLAVLGSATSCGTPTVSIPAAAPVASVSKLDQVRAKYADAMRARPEKEQMRLAFRAAFGADDEIELGSRFTYQPAGLRWIGDLAVLIATGTDLGGCHGCPGRLSVTYLDPGFGDEFDPRVTWFDVAGGHESGFPPQWVIRDDLTGRPVLQSEYGGTWQGISPNFTTLVELGPDGPVTLARGIPYGCETYEYGNELRAISAEILPRPGGTSFVVNYAGTLAAAVTYRRMGNTFEKEPGSPENPDCDGLTYIEEADPRMPAWTEALRALPEARQLQLAHQAVYGVDGAVLEGSTTNTFIPVAIFWHDASDRYHEAATPEAVLIATSTMIPACHRCSGRVEVHYLKPAEHGFSLRESFRVSALQQSMWGDAPDWVLRYDLAEEPVLQVSGTYSGNGYYFRTADLIALGNRGPVSIVQNVLLACDNLGTSAGKTAPKAVTGEIEPLEKGRSFIVRYEGLQAATVVYNGHRLANASAPVPKCS